MTAFDPFTRASRIAAAFAISLLAALAACAPADDASPPRVGFEPITCDSSPSPCA